MFSCRITLVIYFISYLFLNLFVSRTCIMFSYHASCLQLLVNKVCLKVFTDWAWVFIMFSTTQLLELYPAYPFHKKLIKHHHTTKTEHLLGIRKGTSAYYKKFKSKCVVELKQVLELSWSSNSIRTIACWFSSSDTKLCHLLI